MTKQDPQKKKLDPSCNHLQLEIPASCYYLFLLATCVGPAPHETWGGLKSNNCLYYVHRYIVLSYHYCHICSMAETKFLTIP